MAPVNECRCEIPRPFASPIRHECVVCGKPIPSDSVWISSDKNLAEFFDRLEEACFPLSKLTLKPIVPESFKKFRRQCEHRERAGRQKFGFRYLERDNPAEACEEAADGAMYAFLDRLVEQRAGRGDLDIDLNLQMAYHAFKLHEAATKLKARRQGAP